MLDLIRGGGILLLGTALSGLVLARSAGVNPADFHHCAPVGPLQRVALRYVSDGDTVVLADGRRVRLVGINAAEIGRDGRPDEPWAGEAKAALQQFLGAAEVIAIQTDRSPKDRYGRTLAHVFKGQAGAFEHADGFANAACHLLEQGLAWRVTVPPNLHYQADYLAAEARARLATRGLWSAQAAWKLPLNRADGAGFRLLRAQIVGVDFNRDWWLATDSGFVLRIRPSDQQYFERAQLSGLVSRQVEARGWMYQRNASSNDRSGVLLLGHPASIRAVD